MPLKAQDARAIDIRRLASAQVTSSAPGTLLPADLLSLVNRQCLLELSIRVDEMGQ
jgi:hypothetical protein